ncbi:hypothetical protein TRIUR3_09487 [Triticum urartu]|uniref:Uncharacterized protein n=1 Tax=Triticum urartu TaxID=4572 RepID=M7YZU2_TRIUA|nr:hypothetical protein TRIUR3_09487 [Triticum urartu]
MAPLHKFGLAQETFTLKVMLNAYGASAASTRSAALAAMDRRETLNYERVGSSGVPGEHEDDVCVAGREGDHCRRDDVEVLHEHTHTHQDRVPEVHLEGPTAYWEGVPDDEEDLVIFRLEKIVEAFNGCYIFILDFNVSLAMMDQKENI